MAVWIEPEARTWVGALPPMVTVTASIDCLPLPAVITNWPHCAAEPPYFTCCWIGQAATPLGTVTVIVVSFQLPMVAASPPMVTLDRVLQVWVRALGAVH